MNGATGMTIFFLILGVPIIFVIGVIIVIAKVIVRITEKALDDKINIVKLINIMRYSAIISLICGIIGISEGPISSIVFKLSRHLHSIFYVTFVLRYKLPLVFGSIAAVSGKMALVILRRHKENVSGKTRIIIKVLASIGFVLGILAIIGQILVIIEHIILNILDTA